MPSSRALLVIPGLVSVVSSPTGFIVAKAHSQSIRYVYRGDRLWSNISSEEEWFGFRWKADHDSTSFQLVIIGENSESEFVKSWGDNAERDSLKDLVHSAIEVGIDVTIRIENGSKLDLPNVDLMRSSRKLGSST